MKNWIALLETYQIGSVYPLCSYCKKRISSKYYNYDPFQGFVLCSSCKFAWREDLVVIELLAKCGHDRDCAENQVWQGSECVCEHTWEDAMTLATEMFDNFEEE